MHKDLVPIGPFSATLSLAASQIRPIFPEVSVRASRKCLGSCMVESFEGSSVCVCGYIQPRCRSPAARENAPILAKEMTHMQCSELLL